MSVENVNGNDLKGNDLNGGNVKADSVAPTAPSPHITRRDIRAVIIWDFDGTVYRSPAVCRRYGEEIALSLGPEDREEYLAMLDRYLRGEGGVDAADGWGAAVRLVAAYPLVAGRQHASAGQWSEEFRRTREYMDSGDCPLEVPAGLPEAVSRMRTASRHVLVTNTPSWGVFALLERLGVADCFDEVVCEAGKPARLAARVTAAASIYELPMRAVMSVGDHYGNDVAPVLAVGAAAAHVNPYRAGPARAASQHGSGDAVHLEAKTLEELLPAIEGWVATAGDGEDREHGT